MASKKTNRAPKIERNLTRDELAAELDVHAETIGRYDREGAPHERRGRANRYNAPEFKAWMRTHGKTGKEGRPSATEDSPDLEAARLRKENALAAKYELQVQRERGELVPVEDVRQWIGQHVTTLRNRLNGLGAEVTPHLEGRDAAERQTIMEGRITDILSELAGAPLS